MLDLDRIGGITGWQRAAGLAAAYNLAKYRPTFFPEVSAHFAGGNAFGGATGSEYVDWADLILQQPLWIKDGFAIPASNRPGNGG